MGEHAGLGLVAALLAAVGAAMLLAARKGSRLNSRYAAAVGAGLILCAVLLLAASGWADADEAAHRIGH
ncbi:hypothetical protein [Paenibacillus sp. B01]|uniref:hypothetical protein n=1 Tax=Paenibacillus sp. B01 TaxID=2660554 RepID=UPI00129B770B|nr:hypothetical protein [Paenibacillus sp. B01]QGG54821.1 hypothetical protein GE073_03950 [Paenibacillus sp. B01]